MPAADPVALIAQLPKVELHVHLEGSMRPATVVELAARHGVRLTEEEVAARYQYADFHGFLEAYKWVTSFLRTPADYALILERFAAELRAQNVLYAEVTLSAGVMRKRQQDIVAILAALDDAAATIETAGLRLAWIPDATRQFGPEEALAVARDVASAKSPRVIAFGMGGDELAFPDAAVFCPAFEFAADAGWHRMVHAGEIGGPESVRQAVELLGAERIGHGIAVMHDPLVRETLAVLGVSLEVCPTSNLKTGALANQLGRQNVTIEDHPIRSSLRNVLFTISSDDPAMFGTSLSEEYQLLLRLGFTPEEIVVIAMRSAVHAFLPKGEKVQLAKQIEAGAKSLGLV